MNTFYRFLAAGVGIYEAVEKDCPRTDPRRQNKPDGSWLPRVGEGFPQAQSFWTEAGLKKYLDSGLQEWHRSVVSNPLTVLHAKKIDKPLYSDIFQVICSMPQECEELSWEEFAKRQSYPVIEKVVAYIISSDNQKILVFEHDKKWSEAAIQVPAGTVEAKEDISQAALREAQEESGLKDITLVGKLEEYLLYRNTHQQFNRRHVYVMRSESAEGKTWTHSVQGDGIDKGMRFHFFWLSLEEASSKLTASFGYSLGKIKGLA